ncbi:hypothetical protein DM813_11355 [Pseudomonas alkylphenolica]|uniref:Uncharacterized protein n=1 Tax=Pseudomonas alkylphenolica TaxID=237609 RepID=A0A443ZTP1_9PSED|nr:hypothetical protein DM813_11355 [Pseudomonas alkylphenolica]
MRLRCAGFKLNVVFVEPMDRTIRTGGLTHAVMNSGQIIFVLIFSRTLISQVFFKYFLPAFTFKTGSLHMPQHPLD